MYTQWVDTLSNMKLFQRIEKNEISRMLMCLRPKIGTYKKKEYITIAGNTFEGLGIIVEGEVLITKENAAGNRIIMNKLGQGELFGEMIAFSNYGRWPATVIAVADCTILFLSPDKIIRSCPHACESHRILIQNMLAIVSHKALGLNKLVEYLSIKTIRGKVSMYLLEHYNKSQKLTFMIPLKRNELAEFLNIPRPSLSREIIKMKEEGIIDFYKSTFKILNLKALKDSL